MPQVKPHHHPCQTCGAKTECGGTWEENYDGFPSVTCAEFHRENGEVNRDFICHDCNEKELAAARERAAVCSRIMQFRAGPNETRFYACLKHRPELECGEFESLFFATADQPVRDEDPRDELSCDLCREG